MVNFSACGGGRVLDLPRKEAAGYLLKGETGFIRRAELPENFFQAVSRLNELNRVHPAAPFYAGLLVMPPDSNSRGTPSASDSPAEVNLRPSRKLGVLLFCAALQSPSSSARREAARKLIPLILKDPESLAENILESHDVENILFLLDSGGLKENTEAALAALKAACLYRLGRYAQAAEFLSGNVSGNPADDWGKALALFAAWNVSSGRGESAGTLKREILDFLFGEFREAGWRWASGEALSLGGLLEPDERLILSARLSPGNYSANLDMLRLALRDGGSAFIRYPELIADIGRAYQFTPAMREEGAALFAAWTKLFVPFEASGEPFALPSSLAVPESGADDDGNFRDSRELNALVKTLDSGEKKNRTYLLLYYSGRIERARERYAESTQYFKRAAEIAPNDLQSDACIWYMITNAFAGGADAAAALVQSTMPLWKNTSYFSDVLDRLSCHFTRERRWNALMDIFLALENKGRSESLGQYAWILGRAAEEGYLETGRDAESFFRTALAEESSLYYRIMAASKLDARFNPALSSGRAAAGEGEGTRRTQVRPDEVDFMLGFFECGAASFALPYIQAAEAELPAPELRKIAEALGASGRWKESIDFVSRYTRRDNYKTSRADFELLYPRPYKSLIEKYAKEFPREAGMGPELLYGLIRTESYFSPDIVSRSGAVGLAQLMAPTARDMANRIARQGGPDYRGNGEVDLTNPEVNVHIGSYYLSYLAGLLENPMTALIAYNGGLGRVRRWLAADSARGALPPDLFLESVEYTETREYGRRVLAAAAIYGWLYR